MHKLGEKGAKLGVVLVTYRDSKLLGLLPIVLELLESAMDEMGWEFFVSPIEQEGSSVIGYRLDLFPPIGLP
ncbi:hypothetical protein TNCV_316901 [Trichonephila clavipes]|nr:hypothetical protein TNCV_316901 [Trichonephila clavipes]